MSKISNLQTKREIVLPHLGYSFDANNNPIKLTTHNVGGDYVEGGSKYLIENGCVKRGEKYIPNKPNGQPAYPLVTGDTEIKPSTFLNNTPFMVDMKANNPTTDLSVAIWDKSNVKYWTGAVRTGKYFDSANPFNWHKDELQQAFLYENIQDAYKYHIWNKIKQRTSQWKDFFIYNTALTGNDICKAKSYVEIGENYSSVNTPTQICKIDNIV